MENRKLRDEVRMFEDKILAQLTLIDTLTLEVNRIQKKENFGQTSTQSTSSFSECSEKDTYKISIPI